MKKAQSISINTIIVAAIALLVLIVVIFIFSNSTKNWWQNSNSCISQSGSCGDDGHDTDSTCKTGWVANPAAKCDDKGKIICCVQVVKPLVSMN